MAASLKLGEALTNKVWTMIEKQEQIDFSYS